MSACEMFVLIAVLWTCGCVLFVFFFIPWLQQRRVDAENNARRRVYEAQREMAKRHGLQPPVPPNRLELR